VPEAEFDESVASAPTQGAFPEADIADLTDELVDCCIVDITTCLEWVGSDRIDLYDAAAIRISKKAAGRHIE
jgi:hypothetical protein